EFADDLQEMRGRLDRAIGQLDYDGSLAESLGAAGNVILPMMFRLGSPLGRPDSQLPPYVSGNALSSPPDNSVLAAVPARQIIPPIATLGTQAAALGHLNTNLDSDGRQRRELLAVDYYGQWFPSLALAVVARSLNFSPRDIEINPDLGVRVGRLSIATTPALEMLNYYYAAPDGDSAFAVDSFWDLFAGLLPPAKYRDKIVLIGATAPGLGDNFATPVHPAMPPVITLAHTVSSLLQQHFIVQPVWAGYAVWSALLVVAFYLAFVFPRLSSGHATAVSLLLFVGLIATTVGLLLGRSEWVQLMLPASMLFTGHLVLSAKQSGFIERVMRSSAAESVESNKMLALTFQGQGQLDLAFEKFCRIPTDDSMMDLLYNLGLDYERKRQFSKAGAVYQHMAAHDSDYRDLQSRLRRSDMVSETQVLGRAGSSVRPVLLLDEGGVEKPMLGRYEVEKELGKGAMGSVYLGRDPKINRVVAIKVIPLAEEFEESDLEEVKERFFREAETAGRLNHPDIVTIYDAGDEHDLAYIAMEYLTGDHLTHHTQADTLLPLPTVIEIGARTADALAYAHECGVIHRDIKPANIMYQPESGSVKVTDFGIARITDSSKTKTGIILGTPSYMSPEQLAGRKLDGRSDLFALGVSLYQLVTGELPFQADSMSSLMYRIANEPHPPARALREDLPEGLDAVIEQALRKDADERFQSGAEMAEELRRCQQSLVK
ncbi:MAG: serine/threonine-protein kinase, partial [Gammaproteobacteria bacterium]